MKKPSTAMRVFELVHVLALSVWMGAIALSGVVAAVIFPMMRKLKPTLGAYPGYEGDHSTLTAGIVAGNIFLGVDTTQFVCASLALGSFIAMIIKGYAISSLTRVLRSVLLLMTMGVLSYHLVLLMPGMTDDLSKYWDLAEVGDTQSADFFKDSFMSNHEKAANSLKGLLVGVFACLVLAIWTSVGSGDGLGITTKES